MNSIWMKHYNIPVHFTSLCDGDKYPSIKLEKISFTSEIGLHTVLEYMNAYTGGGGKKKGKNRKKKKRWGG